MLPKIEIVSFSYFPVRLNYYCCLVAELVDVIERGTAMPRLPRTVHAQLCSTACRGAIMFGQEISEATARDLLAQISNCSAPFQDWITFRHSTKYASSCYYIRLHLTNRPILLFEVKLSYESGGRSVGRSVCHMACVGLK